MLWRRDRASQTITERSAIYCVTVIKTQAKSEARSEQDIHYVMFCLTMHARKALRKVMNIHIETLTAASLRGRMSGDTKLVMHVDLRLSQAE